MKKLVFFFSFLFLAFAGNWVFDYEKLLNPVKKRVVVNADRSTHFTKKYPEARLVIGPIPYLFIEDIYGFGFEGESLNLSRNLSRDSGCYEFSYVNYLETGQVNFALHTIFGDVNKRTINFKKDTLICVINADLPVFKKVVAGHKVPVTGLEPGETIEIAYAGGGCNAHSRYAVTITRIDDGYDIKIKSRSPGFEYEILQMVEHPVIEKRLDNSFGKVLTKMLSKPYVRNTSNISYAGSWQALYVRKNNIVYTLNEDSRVWKLNIREFLQALGIS